MKIKNNIRKATEIGVGMTVIAALVAGCGGGAAATTAGATSTTSITPFKGRFQSGTATLFDADHVQIATGAINASGVASINYPQGAKFPFVVEVTGSYKNEATGQYETATKPIRGLVKDKTTADAAGANAASGVPVTPMTEIAVASLPVLTGLTGMSAVAAIQKAATKLSFTVAELENPPVFDAAGNTSDPTTLKIAALSLSAATNEAGTGDLAAKIASLATTLASSAAIPATNATLSGMAAALTAVTSGASSVVTTGASAPVVTMSALPTSSVAAIESAVAVTTAQNVAAAASTNQFLTDMTTTGLHTFMPGFTDGTAAGTMYPTGSTITATLANGVYSVTHTIKELINKLWAAITGTSNNSGTSYVLTATGWADQNALPVTFITNADGTATVTNMNGIPGNSIVAVSAVDITGTMPIASAVGSIDANGFFMNLNASGVQATPFVTGNVTFPAGSRQYFETVNGVTTADTYVLWAGLGSNTLWGVTDLNGVALTAVPAAGASFCANGYVFNPITPATQATATVQGAAVSDNYEVLGTMGGCTANSIASSLTTQLGNTIGGIGMGFATLVNKQTGYAAVPTVGYVQSVSVNTANAFAGQNAVQLNGANGQIIGVAGGKARVGMMMPAGTSLAQIAGMNGVGFRVNKTAATAAMNALGFPVM